MSASLFNELEEQLTLAVAGLKHLNEVIGATASALSVNVESKTATATATESTDSEGNKTIDVTIEDKPAPKKKRATRKKTKPKLQEQPELQAETDTTATTSPLDDNTQELDPLGNPINQSTNNAGPQGEVIDINTVRTKIQKVALALNGDTQKIADLMNNRFNKTKLSDFSVEQYPDLLDAVEGLVDIPGISTTPDPLA